MQKKKEKKDNIKELLCPLTLNQSPGPGLEAKVIPACHNDNKQTNLALLCRLEFFSPFYPLVDAAKNVQIRRPKMTKSK